MKTITTEETTENGYSIIAYKITEQVNFFGEERTETRDAGVTIHYNDRDAYVIIDSVVDGVKAKDKSHATAIAEAILLLK